jgi:hypothetical protein
MHLNLPEFKDFRAFSIFSVVCCRLKECLRLKRTVVRVGSGTSCSNNRAAKNSQGHILVAVEKKGKKVE